MAFEPNLDIDYSFRTIITKKGFIYLTIISNEDINLFDDYSWHMSRKNGYLEHINPLAEKIYFHKKVINTPKDMVSDHINGNKLDNRRSNLRNCTNQNNRCNSKTPSHSTTKAKGVCLIKYKHCLKYKATITYKQKTIYLGNFNSIKEAAKAYNDAAIKYFGEFANLNDI